MRSCRGRLVWILLAAAALLLLIAIVAGGVYLVLRGQRSVGTSWQDPVAAVEIKDIAPDLALYPLAGAAPLETVDAAIANGELETAYATLAHDLSASDRQRIGRLILLGKGFALAAGGKPDKASRVYQQIYDLAVLSPSLNDPQRADALLAGGKGWAALGRKAQAQDAYDQAYLIATKSSYLPQAQRRALLGTLELAYKDLGQTEQAQACHDQIVAIDQDSRPQLPAIPAALPELPRGTDAISSSEVGALEETRRKAAFELLQEVSPDSEPPSMLLRQVTQALQAEDPVKLALYRGELESATQSTRRIDVHWQMIRWLTLKNQVATKGFGLSLVPEWEEQVTAIQSALSKEYEDLLFDYEDLVSALPDASLIMPGRYQVLRTVTLAGRLGQYPNYPAEQLVSKLQGAAKAVITSGYAAVASTDALFVDALASPERGAAVRFFFSPAANYGASSETP